MLTITIVYFLYLYFFLKFKRLYEYLANKEKLDLISAIGVLLLFEGSFLI